MGQQIAGTIQSTIGTAVQGVSQGIYGWITGTEEWGDAMRQMGASVLQTIIQTCVQIGVQQALGETAATGATAAGAAARGAIRLGETVFHGIQVAMRTAAHIAGEVASTAATIANVGIRIAMIILESIAYVISAAVEALKALASIPYIGPILGIAAMAAVFAAGIGMVGRIGGREQGGPVEAGVPYIVGETRPEIFIPPTAGRILPSLDAISFSRRQPGLASTSASIAAGHRAGYVSAWGAAKKDRVIAIVKDLYSARTLARDPDFDSVIVDVVRRNGRELLQS